MSWFYVYLEAFWQVMTDLSPSLLLGLVLAGLLHVYLPPRFVHSHLGRSGMGSNVRAALIGVPMPLCSCGVLPTALGLRRDGASPGATTSFLISTPSTGVDSVLVSAAFLGWPFALFKVAAAFVTGVIGGMVADRVVPRDDTGPEREQGGSDPAVTGNRPVAALRYALYDLLGAIDRWILAGVLIAAAITAFIPGDFFTGLGWTQGFLGMLLMLAIATPLYVCTTGSVPIAASLVAAGMPTGTALVFLMAGPATNIATLGAVYRVMGGRLLAVYLGTVVVMSMAFGYGFDFILSDRGGHGTHVHGGLDWLGNGGAVVVLGLMVYLALHRRRARQPGNGTSTPGSGLVLAVEGMSCQHCVATVKAAAEKVPGVTTATPELGSGRVVVEGANIDYPVLRDALEQAGYKVRST